MIEAGAMAAVGMTFAEYAVRLVSDQPQASALVGTGGVRAIAVGAIVFLSSPRPKVLPDCDADGYSLRRSYRSASVRRATPSTAAAPSLPNDWP